MTKITLPMAQMPSVITESLRSVLAAHGYVLAKPVPGDPALAPIGELLDDNAFADVLREAGNNTTMALFSLDESEPIAFSANDFYPDSSSRTEAA